MARSATSAVEEVPVEDTIVQEPERVIQMVMDHSTHPWLLTNEGRIFQRGEDKDKLGWPGGPHWKWHEVAGPV